MKDNECECSECGTVHNPDFNMGHIYKLLRKTYQKAKSECKYWKKQDNMSKREIRLYAKASQRSAMAMGLIAQIEKATGLTTNGGSYYEQETGNSLKDMSTTYQQDKGDYLKWLNE